MGIVIYLSHLSLSQWVYKQNIQYDDVAPTFEKLRVDQGLLLTFTERWKGMGGEAIIRIENGSVITLSCGGEACYRKEIDGKLHNLRVRAIL